VKRVSPQSLFLEDFAPGMRIRGRVGRTVTDADNIWFTLMTNNGNQIHFNADYASKEFAGEPFKGRMVVNGFFTLATVAGILVEQTSGSGFMLGIDKVRYMKPVFAGDTIYAECEVTRVRRSKSNKRAGIVTLKTWGHNQNGEKVIEFERKFMVRSRRA
jgi:acyl dehydratase